jgi:hypothetical protein
LSELSTQIPSNETALEKVASVFTEAMGVLVKVGVGVGELDVGVLLPQETNKAAIGASSKTKININFFIKSPLMFLY